MRIRSLLWAAAMLLLAAGALAEGTRLWTQSTYDEFEKGTASGVAIGSDGRLFLAPSFRALTTTPSTYLWAIASDAAGNVYAAAGAPARVYRITPGGATSVIFRPAELQVQAIVVAPDGVVYAATSPDGKVYRLEHEGTAAASAKAGPDVDPSWRSSVYFDPGTKYIWALALDARGRLYVGTGDHGQIFRVDAAGKGSVFFTSDEAHIRVLAFDHRGNLIAGSDGSGLVYRISPDGNAFVLYSAAKKEITALAVDAADNIYAAGVGDKRPSSEPAAMPPASRPALVPAPAPGATPAPAEAGQAVSAGASAQDMPTITITAPVTTLPAAPSGFTTEGGSEIYRIAADGTPQRIWASRDALVYALAFDAQGDLVVGTGNSGHIFAIRDSHEFADLVKASASQVLSFAAAPGGGLYAATSNLAKVFLLGAAPGGEGSYVSDTFDARIFSRWGRLQLRSHGLVDLYARSGNVDNPDRNWSAWQKVDLEKGAELDVPPARFVQWKAVLRPGAQPPVVESVGVNYRPNNVPPTLDNVAVQVGFRYATPPRLPGVNLASIVPMLSKDRDSVAVRWSASDADDDTLEFAIYYRGDSETQWKLLKDRLSDNYYTFDATALPDGGYKLKVVASDAPSHSPGEAMSASDQSPRFEIDNTPPVVEDLAAVPGSKGLHVTFRAADSFSPVKRAEYSLDGGDWQFIEPVGLLSDSKVENYDFTIAVPHDPDGEHSVVVRAYDRFDNLGSAKAIVRAR
jgi:sugar lactone lactonase YvrE